MFYFELMDSVIQKVNKKYMKKRTPDVMTGDIVRVYQKVKEGGKERTQVFEGVVISREGGYGMSASVTVRKISNGVGVEKKFLLHSPVIEKVQVTRSSKVRRKKIFYLRGLTGKAAKMKEKQRKILEEIGDDTKNTDEENKDVVEEEEKKDDNEKNDDKEKEKIDEKKETNEDEGKKSPEEN